MAYESTDTITPVFGALADPTRRAILHALARGPRSVSDLAADHDMALPSFLKHIGKLEKSGLVTSDKQGRSRMCRLRPDGFAPAQNWLAQEQARWGGALDRLAMHLETLEKGPRQ
ncbi:metalloregulator ArsR/SmtB family transcription factor [uncultured Tateyamaria sp.]|uniref:ArsR/SmtB family transcription factor n=1 Tax=uncultured Tateyamaria sp. TaxID=455651 RepID=UPI002607A4D5|nr:metalloregulator ArsR/SmtB family transcription factor [uncultured Tateyamaria sp.]